jgi:hypothetical protein
MRIELVMQIRNIRIQLTPSMRSLRVGHGAAAQLPLRRREGPLNLAWLSIDPVVGQNILSTNMHW